MELDELKTAWGRLNDKVDGQRLVEKDQIEAMLSKKKARKYNRLLWSKRIFICLLILVLLFSLFSLHTDFFYVKLRIAAFAIACSIALGVNLFQYYRLKKAGCMKYNIECQITSMLEYMSSVYWGSIIIYLAFLPAIILLIIFSDLMGASILVGWVLVAVLLDVCVFRHISRTVGKLVDVNRELANLKELLSN